MELCCQPHPMPVIAANTARLTGSDGNFQDAVRMRMSVILVQHRLKYQEARMRLGRATALRWQFGDRQRPRKPREFRGQPPNCGAATTGSSLDALSPTRTLAHLPMLVGCDGQSTIGYRSSGCNPVFLAICARRPGPTSSLSWKANV